MPSSPTGEHALAITEAPVRFGKYTLLTRLATGGMGEVYVAQMGGAAGFEKQVVIKRILPQLARDEQFVQMFLDEARITAQLNHPNICQVFELGEIDGEYYIAMEYLEGLPLSRLIEKRGRGGLDVRIVAGLLVQACEGLSYAHEFRDPARRIDGVVHRDVSPQNLFVTAPGLVKVLDFGVAKLYREGSKTVTVSTKGKYLYMSPEQVNGDPVDQRSDIFALATIMFEALSGQSLFGRATQFLTLQAIVRGDRPRIRALRPDVPAAVESVLERALSLDREARYPTARAMTEALTFAVSSLGGPASIIELAQFVQREHTDHLTSERARIQRASAHVQSSSELSSDLLRIVSDRSRPGLRELDNLDGYEDELGEQTIEAPPALLPPLHADQAASPQDGVEAGALVAGHDAVALHDIDLRSAHGRRYLRWAVVATVTVVAVLWLGRDFLRLGRTAAPPSAPAHAQQARPGTPAVPAVVVEVPDERPAATPPAASAGEGPPGVVSSPEEPGGAAGDAPGAQASTEGAGDTGGTGEAARAEDTGNAGSAGEAARAVATDAARREDARPARAQERPRRARRRVREVARRSGEDGFFTIDAQPYAEVYIDGKRAGLTPLVQLRLAPGRHRVRAVAVQSGVAKSFRINISPKKTVTRQISFAGDD